MALPFLGPAMEEWHKLPRGGKIAVGVAFLAVAGFGYYEYRKNASQSSGTQSPDLATTANGLPASSFSGVDLSSLAGSIAGLINVGGNQGTGTTSSSTATAGTTFTLPAGTPTNFRFDKSGGSTIWYGPSGANKHQSLQALFPSGTTFRTSGSQLFYTLPGGNEQLFAHPISGTAGKKGGGGPMHTSVPYRTLSFDTHVVQRYVQNDSGHMHPQSFKVS